MKRKLWLVEILGINLTEFPKEKQGQLENH